MVNNSVVAARIVASLLALLLLIVYVRYYTNSAVGTAIIQAPLSALSFDLLNSKKPLLVEDRVVSSEQFIQTVLAYQYISAPVIKRKGSRLQRNWSKWLLIHSLQETNAKVQIAHPMQLEGKQAYIDVLLQPKQLILVPYRWWVGVDAAHANIEMRAIDDSMSFVLSAIQRSLGL